MNSKSFTMNALFVVSTENEGLIFGITYMAALAFGAFILLLNGYRKKYNMGSMLLITLSCLVFFILGDKLITVSPDRWHELLIENNYAIPTGKNLLGGIIGLLTGTFIAVKWLKFKEPLLDLLAIAFPIAIAVQKIGCLMGGCCHGKPSNLPWAIQYTANSDAFHHQLQAGMISYDHAQSIPVHPTQLYQIIGCLLISFLVFRYRHHWKSKGNLFLFAILLYCVLRFMTEFFKDPLTNGLIGQAFMGLQLVQWGILIAMTIITFLIIIREKYFIRQDSVSVDSKISWRHYSLFSIIVLLLLSQWGWFEYKEKFMILSLAIPISIFLFWRSYKSLTIPVIRWSLPFILLGGFLFMGQKVITNDKTNPHSYAEFSFGAGFGRFYNEVRERVGTTSSIATGESCSGGTFQYTVYSPVYDYHDRRHSFETYALGAKYVFRFGQFKKLHLGASYFWCTEHETDSESTYSKYYVSKGFCPMIKMDWHWVGIGIGGNFGDLRYAKNNNYHEGDFDQMMYTYDMVPSVHLRVGPYEYFFAEYNYANSFPSSSPAPLMKGGIGSGLGKTDGTKIVMGATELGLYAEADVVIKNNYVVSLMCNGNFDSGITNQRMICVGFKYRLYSKAKEK